MTATDDQRVTSMADVGLALSVACAVVLAWAVEWMAVTVRPALGDLRSQFVLALFVVPLLISLGAIALSLRRRPAWARWTSGMLIVLVPPALLVSGALHG